MTSLISRSRRPDISFYKNGHIDITSHLAKQLGLRNGDVINIAVHKGEFLLYVLHKAGDVIGIHEGCVHQIKKCKSYSNYFRVYSRKLTDAMFRAAGLKDTDTASLRLYAGEPVSVDGISTAIPLITRNPIINCSI